MKPQPAPDPALLPIDYDRIYAAYLQSLVDTLRGFSPGIPGLEFWVPDEDPLISLRHLLDAALAAGHSALAVRFGSASLPRIALDQLGALAQRYGRAAVRATGRDVVVTIDQLAAPARGAEIDAAQGRGGARPTARATAPAPTPVTPTATPSDAYAGALARAAHQIRHEAATDAVPFPAPFGDRVVISARAASAQLFVAIDPRSHEITTARFSGAPTPDARALLECFCALITGLPLLEAAQHGVLRLEAALRDPTGPRPVPGIVLPRAAHPRFALPAALIAQALASYRAATGYVEQRAVYHLAPGPRWQAAALAERRAAIDAVLADAAPAGTTLLAIEHQVRIVVGLPEDLDSGARQTLLMQIERAIKNRVDARLEVHGEDRKDRNKLRRLAVVPPK